MILIYLNVIPTSIEKPDGYGNLMSLDKCKRLRRTLFPVLLAHNMLSWYINNLFQFISIGIWYFMFQWPKKQK